MSRIIWVGQIVLGLIYFIFGLNGIYNFLPLTPPPLPESATQYMNGIMAAGYFMPLLKWTEAIGGFLLLSTFAVPLSLVVLAPITLHIFLFHLKLTPGVENLILPSIMLVLHILLGFRYWKIFRNLFSRGL